MQTTMRTLSLTRQLISIIVILVFCTALITALPPLFALQNELDRQLNLRLDTGEQHTLTIWTLTELQIRQSVTQAAKRPTLKQLVGANEQTILDGYLETFRVNTPLDFLYVKNKQGEILGGTPLSIPVEFDQITLGDTFPIYAVQASMTENVSVIGGISLDDGFLQLLRQQTDFIYQLENQQSVDNHYRSRQVYLTKQFALQMLLDVEDTRFVQLSAFMSVIGVALVTATVGSLIGGLYLRHRIRPLWRLRSAAENLGNGDLITPITADSYLPEIRILTKTLEQSRQRLGTMIHQLQSERDWSNALMQSIVEGIITINQKHIIIFHSESTLQIMNWDHDCIGEDIDHVFLIPDSNQSFSDALPAEGGHKMISVLSSKNQAIDVLITRARSLPDGEMTFVIRDVTEENRQSNAQAYYLANMSHEFRTPLSGMKASLELLTENDRSLARTERQQLLNSLLMSVSNLQRLIDNLLEGSKLQTQKFSLHIQPLHFEQILMDALHTMQPLLTRRQQWLSLTIPFNLSVVRGDRTRLVQVLVNLLSNASKYSPQASEIDITIRRDATDLWVGIGDHGQGIPDNRREAVFQQFVRLEQGAGSDHSAGLGLSVVRGVIEAHSGKVGVEPRDAGGSIFWFSIPLTGASEL